MRGIFSIGRPNAQSPGGGSKYNELDIFRLSIFKLKYITLKYHESGGIRYTVYTWHAQPPSHAIRDSYSYYKNNLVYKLVPISYNIFTD